MLVLKNLIGGFVRKCMLIFTYLPDGKTVKQQYLIAGSAAVVIHLVMGIVLMMNADFTPPVKATPKKEMQVIDAVVIDESKLQQHVDKIKQQKAAVQKREDDRIKELERRAQQAQQKRRQEAERLKQLERDKLKKLNEKKKAEADAKRAKDKALAEQKLLQQKEQERRQAEQAAAEAKAKRLKAEEEERKAAEERRRKKIEEEKRRKAEAERAEQQRLLEQQMLEEMAARQSARSQQVMTEVEKYSALITQAIERNFIQDESTMRGKSCQLKIKLASNGFVINVQAIQGDQVVCQEAMKAVNKAGTLPVSKDPLVFEKLENISLTYAPKFN
ncbi:cell envelope integrity protein TolA [Thalassotalea aquiviva]|uniref:cell envelope integrity protein TolA n=1 Tax=Thalassotalea aquiviva TaxID=3242415 RepID=UPI00352BBC1E